MVTISAGFMTKSLKATSKLTEISVSVSTNKIDLLKKRLCGSDLLMFYQFKDFLLH